MTKIFINTFFNIDSTVTSNIPDTAFQYSTVPLNKYKCPHIQLFSFLTTYSS